jgi:hypothetical protein
MLNLSYLHLLAAALGLAALVAVEARSAEFEGAPKSRPRRSERMPNRYRRLEPCRSS